MGKKYLSLNYWETSLLICINRAFYFEWSFEIGKFCNEEKKNSLMKLRKDPSLKDLDVNFLRLKKVMILKIHPPGCNFGPKLKPHVGRSAKKK